MKNMVQGTITFVVVPALFMIIWSYIFMNKLKFYIRRIKEGRLRELIEETIWIYKFARQHWGAMIFYTLLGMSGIVISLVTSLISRDMVDIVTGQQAGKLMSTFSMYIGFTIGNLIVSQVASYFSSKISINVDNSIKASVFDKMLTTDLESIWNYHTGDLLTRWSIDAGNISNGILNWVPNLIINIARFISTFVLVFYNDKMFALLALIGAPISMIVSKPMLKRMRKNNEKSAAMGAKMSGFNQETFSNIQTIKAFDLISVYSNKLRSLQSDFLSMKLEFQKLNMWVSFFMAIVGLVVSYSCYGFGIYRVWSGAISYGTMTMFLSLAGNLTGTFNQLTSLVPNAISITTSARRLMDILQMPQEDFSKTNEADELRNNNLETGLSIKFTNLTYGYKGSDTNVFEGADFEAKPQNIVALVGPSGEGKTTMLRLILGLLKRTSGEALIYGEDISDGLSISPSTRRLFSYVPQGNTMFSGTIAENMRNVKADASDEEIIEALKTACAWEFVEKLPDGINSKIGERGGGFSEGQAQRLSIARSLIRRSPILLLDEATSALDVATERKVLKNIICDEYPRTCIVTTHRPTVLSACSRVYAIKNKKCVVLNEEEIQQMAQDF